MSSFRVEIRPSEPSIMRPYHQQHSPLFNQKPPLPAFNLNINYNFQFPSSPASNSTLNELLTTISLIPSGYITPRTARTAHSLLIKSHNLCTASDITKPQLRLSHTERRESQSASTTSITQRIFLATSVPLIFATILDFQTPLNHTRILSTTTSQTSGPQSWLRPRLNSLVFLWNSKNRLSSTSWYRQ